MALHLLFRKLLRFSLLLMLVVRARASLLSRFRNRQEYVPNADLEMIKSLDDETYEDLMNEIPILRQVFRGNRGQSDHHLFNSTALPYLYRSGGRGVAQRTRPPAPSAGGASPTRGSLAPNTRWPPLRYVPSVEPSPPTRGATPPAEGAAAGAVARSGEGSAAGGGGGDDWHLKYPYVTSCYWCGLNESLLPVSTLCHDAFASPEVGTRSASRFFRAQCYFYDKQPRVQQLAAPTYPPPAGDAGGGGGAVRRDRGLKVRVFGPYMRGCFKRFVDVGPLYTSRGCRGAYLPQRAYSRTFASHRLMRLEVVARGHRDVCVHSPAASLTPFSRALSLYVRYHVCVCSRPYCNAAAHRAHARAHAAALLTCVFIFLCFRIM